MKPAETENSLFLFLSPRPPSLRLRILSLIMAEGKSPRLPLRSPSLRLGAFIPLCWFCPSLSLPPRHVVQATTGVRDKNTSNLSASFFLCDSCFAPSVSSPRVVCQEMPEGASPSGCSPPPLLSPPSLPPPSPSPLLFLLLSIFLSFPSYPPGIPGP